MAITKYAPAAPYTGKGQKYPDDANQTKKRKEVAGIKIKPFKRSHDLEDEVACGPGQATEVMGSVHGSADASARDGLFVNRMKKIR